MRGPILDTWIPPVRVYMGFRHVDWGMDFRVGLGLGSNWLRLNDGNPAFNLCCTLCALYFSLLHDFSTPPTSSKIAILYRALCICEHIQYWGAARVVNARVRAHLPRSGGV